MIEEDGEMDAVDRALRALNLALAIGDRARTAMAVEGVLDLHRRIAQPNAIGTWNYVFDSLYRKRGIPLTEAQKEEIIGALEHYLAVCCDRDSEQRDPCAAREAAKRLRVYYRDCGRNDDAKRAILGAGLAFEHIAQGATHVQGLLWLEDVYQDYREVGLKNEARRVLREMEGRGAKAQKDLVPMAMPLEVCSEELQDAVDRLTEGGFETACQQVAYAFIPDLEESCDALERSRKTCPLLSLVPVTKISAGHIAAQIGSLDKDPSGRLIDELSLRTSLASLHLRATLDCLRERYGADTNTWIDYLTRSPVFDRRRLAILRRGLHAYFDGDYLTAVHLVVPLIEYSMRRMLQLLGQPSTRPGRERGMYQQKSLSEVLYDPCICAALPGGWVIY